MISKKLKLNSNTVLSVIFFEKISFVKKNTNAKNSGKIKGINILNGL